MRIAVRLFMPALLVSAALAQAAETNWVAGTNYYLLQPAQPTNAPAGKIEVTEVFSYACPACNRFYPVVDKLRTSLPANVVLDFVPAAFNTSEDWPVFQRAYLTAKVLGVDKKTHDAMFDAIWKSGELAVVDPNTNRLRAPAPSIEDAAKFYQRVAGVNPDTFVNTAKSFAVDTQIRQSDQLVKDYMVAGTPTIIVNGKYRLDVESAGGYDQVIALVKYLVAVESGGAKPAKTTN